MIPLDPSSDHDQGSKDQKRPQPGGESGAGPAPVALEPEAEGGDGGRGALGRGVADQRQLEQQQLDQAEADDEQDTGEDGRSQAIDVGPTRSSRKRRGS
ncbi:MAG: hypothetical protein U0R26_11390 [Solirubrobacterales bacterium]